MTEWGTSGELGYRLWADGKCITCTCLPLASTSLVWVARQSLKSSSSASQLSFSFHPPSSPYMLRQLPSLLGLGAINTTNICQHNSQTQCRSVAHPPTRFASIGPFRCCLSVLRAQKHAWRVFTQLAYNYASQIIQLVIHQNGSG